MNYYNLKAAPYFQETRSDLIAVLPQNPKQRVLEVGAGSGNTLCAIKTLGLASEVVGLELFAFPDSNQQNPLIDQFIIGDVEQIELPFLPETFDTILCGDVLEHLVDPWQVVDRLATLLRPGGVLIVSVPNIRHYKILLEVFGKGTFRYDPAGGIMDKTHLRFFCRKNIADMLSTPMLTVKSIASAHDVRGESHSVYVRLLNYLSGGFFRELFVSQYIGTAIKQ